MFHIYKSSRYEKYMITYCKLYNKSSKKHKTIFCFLIPFVPYTIRKIPKSKVCRIVYNQQWKNKYIRSIIFYDSLYFRCIKYIKTGLIYLSCVTPNVSKSEYYPNILIQFTLKLGTTKLLCFKTNWIEQKMNCKCVSMTIF